MKKANTIIQFKFKDANSMFIARKILMAGFHFLEDAYDTETVETTLDHEVNMFFVSLSINFSQSSDTHKLENCIELFNELDLFLEEQEPENRPKS